MDEVGRVHSNAIFGGVRNLAKTRASLRARAGTVSTTPQHSATETPLSFNDSTNTEVTQLS